MGIKLNKNYTDAITDCTLVDTATQTATFSNEIAETILKWIAHSYTTTSPSDNKEYLRYLDAKLSAVRKTATFWDAYNIRDAATTADELIQKYAALPNNTALVIDTSSIDLNDETFARGDIVLKDNYGNQVHIKNEQQGTYKPGSVEEDGSNLKLTFNYTANTDTEDTAAVILPTNVKPNDGSLYSVAVTSDSFTWTTGTTTGTYSISYIKVNNTPVMPFWECREYNTSTEKIGDKIFDLISLSRDDTNSKWIFTASTDAISFILIIK